MSCWRQSVWNCAHPHALSLPLKDVRDDALPANSVRSLRIPREAACTVSQLLDDVLYVARFQTNRLKLRPQELDLSELTAQVRKAHAPMALAKRLNLASTWGAKYRAWCTSICCDSSKC